VGGRPPARRGRTGGRDRRRRTLLLSDRHGNNRLDRLTNTVCDGRVALMVFVAGSHNVTPVNGTALVVADPKRTGRFDRQGR